MHRVPNILGPSSPFRWHILLLLSSAEMKNNKPKVSGRKEMKSEV